MNHQRDFTQGIDPAMSVVTSDALVTLTETRTPYWVFDIHRARVSWANQAALDLWNANSIQELRERDMSRDMSGAVKSRLLQYQNEFQKGRVFDETWTLYPKGIPTTALCRFRGFQTDGGDMAMFCEGQLIADQSPEILRGGQALLYTGAMVSTYSAKGALIYANPAAIKAFDQGRMDLQDRLPNAQDVAAILRLPMETPAIQVITNVHTKAGNRLHEIEVARSYDALTGEPTLLLTEVDITEKERAKVTAERAANIDVLTNLYNRNYLTDFAPGFIQAAHKTGRLVCLGLFDLDRFKVINDTHGHEVGDALLRFVASEMRRFFGMEATLTRFGGDEFCFLVSCQTSAKNVLANARNFLKEINKPHRICGREIFSSVSLGMVTVSDSAKNMCFDDMLRNADLALYEAKALGGNTIRQFRPALARKRLRFLSVEAELGQAIASADSRFSLMFQPKVDLNGKRVIGAEALSRLKDSNGKAISPVEFIPIAESTGLIHKLGARVISEAAARLGDMPPSGRVSLSVNVSPTQFKGTKLMAQLRELAGMSGFDPALLELELTESALHLADKELLKKLNELVELGYPISIDDFGAAYSNIARLSSYPVSCLKFDRSLIATKNNDALSRVVINIGMALNLRIIAEGVETIEQRDWLIQNGCYEHQGFLYSPPTSFETVLNMIQSPSQAFGEHVLEHSGANGA